MKTDEQSRKVKNKKKILVLVSALVVVLLGAGLFILLFTYKVSGKITDIASQKPIEGVAVGIDGIKNTTNTEGNYSLEHIKIYQKKNLTISVPSQYEKVGEVKIEYKTRDIKKDLELEPTLDGIVGRHLIASKNGQYDYLWDLMHPDDRAYWGSREEYSLILKQVYDIQIEVGIGTKSMNIGNNIRKLDTWKSPVTSKEYKDIMEVPIEGIYVENGKEQPQNDLRYYQRIDGFYHYFTSRNKEETKKLIDDYKKYKEEMKSL